MADIEGSVAVEVSKGGDIVDVDMTKCDPGKFKLITKSMQVPSCLL